MFLRLRKIWFRNQRVRLFDFMKIRTLWHFNGVTYFILDYSLMVLAVICALKLSPRFQEDILDGILFQPGLRLLGYGLPFSMAIGSHIAGLQKSQTGFRMVETFVKAVIGLAAGILVFVVLRAFTVYGLVGRLVLAICLVYGVSLILVSRFLIWRLAERHSRNILIYGSQRICLMVSGFIAAAQLPIRVFGYTRIIGGGLSPDGVGRSVSGLSLKSFCEDNAIDEVVVEVPDALAPNEREALLYCTAEGFAVTDISYFYEKNLERIDIFSLKESWFWGYDASQSHPVYFFSKRFLDLLISLAGLILFLPLSPFVFIIIKIQDGGPVFYSQVRTGLYNKPFHIYKFRTMRIDAEADGARWAAKADGRATRFGVFLRKTRLDEVPQFWNIILGDMSFIGPRPERPEFIDKIEQQVGFYRYRHLIKPGLSGWAQVNYPYGASIEDAREKLSFDLYYLKNASPTLDLLILLRTVVSMVRGAR
jgi:exopolysaccharide biosynthesis polyprenyl glycosylphosphotransferase